MKHHIAAGLIAVTVLAAGASALHAEDRKGQIQVKVLATGVLPDGKISKIETDIVDLPANIQTKANDNYVPTVAVEYFVTDNVSVETICCLTQHDVDGTTGLPGAELVSNAKLVPATVTAKYHIDLGTIKPYFGAGPAYFIWLNEKPGAATIPLNVTDFTMSDELGLALQAGFDVPVNDRGLAFSIDAKRYFINTTARWFAGNTLAIQTEHRLDPWVISAGAAFRF